MQLTESDTPYTVHSGFWDMDLIIDTMCIYGNDKIYE